MASRTRFLKFAIKLAVKLYTHSVQYAYKLVSTRRALAKSVRKLLLQIIIKTRNGELLVIPLIPSDLYTGFLAGAPDYSDFIADLRFRMRKVRRDIADMTHVT